MKYYKVLDNINTIDAFIGHVGYAEYLYYEDKDFIYLVIPYFNDNEKYSFLSSRVKEISKKEYIKELFRNGL